MSGIGDRVNEVCPCGHRGGRHADLGDGFCHDCPCPEFGAGPQDVAAIIEALAAEQEAARSVEVAEAAHLESQKHLARMLGRPDDGKDFWFDADYAARGFIVAEAIRERATDESPSPEGEGTRP